jgi:taurine dioxygenase
MLEIRRLGYAMGAEICGVDASKPLDAETIVAIRRAWQEHIVVRLPGQDLNAEQLRAFGAQFGQLDDHRSDVNRNPDMHEVTILSNKTVTRTGGVERKISKTLSDVWHSDSAFNDRVATISFLLAKALPDVGGDTMFANMYLAYESLSPAFQEILDPLQAVHDYKLGEPYLQACPEEREGMVRFKAPIVHAVVKAHPDTGRKALYFSGQIRNFVGMTEEETKPVVRFLEGHASRYEFSYRRRWAFNDLVMWDNRCAMHMALQDYDRGQLRSMIRCELMGPKSGTQLVAPERTPALSAAAD